MRTFAVRVAFLMAMVFVFSVALAIAAENEAGGPATTQIQGEAKETQAQSGQSPAKALMGGIRASKVIGKPVINTKGEKLGHVEDLVLNKDGCADYIVLGHGGLLGIGNKLIPIPWKSVQTGTQSDVLIVEASKANLEKAPTFETKSWPDFANPEWRKKIFEFFGVSSGNKKDKNQ